MFPNSIIFIFVEHMHGFFIEIKAYWLMYYQNSFSTSILTLIFRIIWLYARLSEYQYNSL